MPSLIRQGFAVIRPATTARGTPEIGLGQTQSSAYLNLEDLVRKKYRDSLEVVHLSYSSTVEEEVVYPLIPQAGRVWHVWACPFTRQEYDEWLEAGGRLIQEVVPLTWRVFREGVIRLAPQELATIDCDWEWTGSDPTTWPEAVAYLPDEVGRAAILITQVRAAAGLQRLQHPTPPRLAVIDWTTAHQERVELVSVEVPPMLEAAFGYQGRAPKVAFCPDGIRRTRSWWDGQDRGTGSWESWTTFLRHPRIRPSVCYRSLGVDESEARHWLVLNRQTRLLYVGEAARARRYLRQGCIIDGSFQPMVGGPEVLAAALQAWLDTKLPGQLLCIPWASGQNELARTEEATLQKTPVPDATPAVAQPSPKRTTRRTTKRTK